VKYFQIDKFADVIFYVFTVVQIKKKKENIFLFPLYFLLISFHFLSNLQVNKSLWKSGVYSLIQKFTENQK